MYSIDIVFIIIEEFDWKKLVFKFYSAGTNSDGEVDSEKEDGETNKKENSGKNNSEGIIN